MNLSEKSAYLKGLMDGLKLDQEAPEGKMISGIVELLQEVTGAIGDLQENAEAVSDELDEIEDDLDAIEDYLMATSRPSFRIRANTRSTLPSTAGTGRPKLMEAMAPAVYAPTPGSFSSAS